MAKSGVLEGDSTMVAAAAAAKASELKKELQKLVTEIVDLDDINLDEIDRAQYVLCNLKELKLKKSVVALKVRSSNHNSGHEIVSGAVPEEFKCPLSKELMRDPVIIASGQTFDKPFIRKWLQAGNKTCPHTQQVLSHTILTPNHLIRTMIAQWCKNHGVKLPDSVNRTDEEGLTKADKDHFVSLLKKMSSSLPHQKESAKELRLLTKRLPSFRALFGEESLDAIPKLLSPLSQAKLERDLQEDLITTLLNISIHENNKKLVLETPNVLPLLMEALRSGTIETKSNAAAALFTLSALDSNKAIIGRSGALKPLIDLLDEGHPLVMKDVASAIFNLCILHENKARVVSDGGVRVIMKKILNRTHVDELLSIVAMLSSSQRAIEEMVELGAVPCLLSIIRESSCARNKENCIAILHAICFSDRSKWKEMKEEESKYCTISQLVENGSSRAKRKASGVLERMNRANYLTHTA